jgi:hypothetical protein
MMEGGPTDKDAQKYRYRVFLIIECMLLVVTGVGSAAFFSHTVGKWAIRPLTILWVWHTVAIPICFMYLIGRPIIMTLSPLVMSAESREFRRQLEERPVLSDDEFYVRYYEGSSIPRDIPARLRRSLLNVDSLLDRAIPSDFLFLLDDEMDFGEVLCVVEREFDIHFATADCKDMDGTFDDLVHQIHMRLNPESR